MSISTEQAEKMIDEKMAREAAPAQPEQNDKPDTEQSTPAPEEKPQDKPEEKPEDKPEETKPEDKPEEKPEEKKPEDKPEEKKPDEDDKDKSDKKLPPRKKYTHEERVAHAFNIEKQKRKEQHAKDRARIKELEEELAKYKGLSLKDFDNNVENYTDWRLKERDMQNEVQSTKERVEREEADELQKETERRVNLSFATDDERDEYNELIRTNGPKFYEALQQADPNGVVLDYLNSVEKYPIVLRELMTNMDSLRHVFRDKDPVVLRFNLHQFTKELLEGKKQPEAKPEETKPQENKPEQKTTTEAKPAIPVIGKQVTTSAAPGEPVHDRAYWNNYLKQHPRG